MMSTRRANTDFLTKGCILTAWSDRERLWNDVESFEKRKDAQLCREVEFAIPRELDQAEVNRLARDFVEQEFVARGMVADLNVHWDRDFDGEAYPHAHVMLTMREVKEEGFGAKVREWNATSFVEHWREAWALHVNERMAELDLDIQIDHRSLEAQGIGLEPQHKIGAASYEMDGRSERLDDHARIARENGERIIANPKIAIEAITRQQSTFTHRDLARFLDRHSYGREQFKEALIEVMASPELVRLGEDDRGHNRFTSQEMVETEARLRSQRAELVAPSAVRPTRAISGLTAGDLKRQQSVRSITARRSRRAWSSRDERRHDVHAHASRCGSGRRSGASGFRRAYHTVASQPARAFAFARRERRRFAHGQAMSPLHPAVPQLTSRPIFLYAPSALLHSHGLPPQALAKAFLEPR